MYKIHILSIVIPIVQVIEGCQPAGDENTCERVIEPSVSGICAGAGTVASTAMCLAMPIVGCILGWGATGLICTGVSSTVHRGKTIIFQTMNVYE